MERRVADTQNYSVEWTNEELLQANVTRNKKQGSQETGAQVDLRKLKRCDYSGACSRRCLLFSRGLCVHICTALQRAPARFGGPLKWEDFLPQADTMDAWEA